jgi:hypothetical protein
MDTLKRERTMKKTLLAALAAVTLVGATLASTSDSEARRWGRGFGIGLGIGLIGTAIAHGAYAHDYDEGVYYVRKCRYVERYNRHGDYIGTRRICSVVPY